MKVVFTSPSMRVGTEGKLHMHARSTPPRPGRARPHGTCAWNGPPKSGPHLAGVQLPVTSRNFTECYIFQKYEFSKRMVQFGEGKRLLQINH